ncbi:uncharacterized protein LOC128554240 [Mercenaria mercenaria]|uniref:uncharacterized protein LOC128554240 n=1 Tax=Mercenaria mercenaria TaxID=6596 RepID=UPI00234F0CDF|nr:uncharacterized protein LOC128554240 [Mercenaria mercenaria]
MKVFVKYALSTSCFVIAINVYFAYIDAINNRCICYQNSLVRKQDKLSAGSNISSLSRPNDDAIGNILRKSNSSSYANVPNIIMQYGIGGTATTLQFQILCVLMAILHESESNSVGCFYGSKPFYKYTVIKTHNMNDNALRSLPSDSWIFTTSSNSFTSEKQQQFDLNQRKIKELKLKCPYTADIETVSKRGHFIVYEYQSIFGVSNEQIMKALEYLRYWDILRLCCGKQMSADWRNRLSPRKKYRMHHDPHSSTYPACEMYSISEVENLLIKTYVFQRFAHISSLHDIIGKPSNVDGEINGHYCEQCNRNISIHHLHFNDNCV